MVQRIPELKEFKNCAPKQNNETMLMMRKSETVLSSVVTFSFM